jgi:hypothetical protein
MTLNPFSLINLFSEYPSLSKTNINQLLRSQGIFKGSSFISILRLKRSTFSHTNFSQLFVTHLLYRWKGWDKICAKTHPSTIMSSMDVCR